MKTYGIREQTIVTSELEQHIEEIKIFGFTIVRSVLDSDLLETTREQLDSLYQKQCHELGGENNLSQINDANIIRCPLAENSLFLQLATLPKILMLMKKAFGDYYILQQQNGVLLPPNTESYQMGWHRDLPYQHFVASRPLAISALFCIDAFNVLTGGTHVLPASHKAEMFPSNDYVTAHEVGIDANPGDALVFDSMLYHRSGSNSAAKVRRGLNHVYALPFFKQQINLPKALKGKYSEDAFLNKFLGYEGEPAESAFDWRNKRLENFEVVCEHQEK